MYTILVCDDDKEIVEAIRRSCHIVRVNQLTVSKLHKYIPAFTQLRSLFLCGLIGVAGCTESSVEIGRASCRERV